jgi:hypothetical protein
VPDRRFPLLHRGSPDPGPTSDEPTAVVPGADAGEGSVAVLDDETTGQLPGWSEPTGEYGVDDSGDDENDGPGADEDWLVPDRRRRVRIAVPTLVLCGLILVAGAFWGGAVVDKHFGNHGTTSAAAGGRTAGAFAGFGGGTGTGGTGTGAAGGTAGGFGGFSRVTPAAEGTLSAIDGQTLTVTPTSGSPVKVKLTAETVVTRSGTGAPGALTVGDTVTVDGTAGSGGVVTATSVTATAAGVSTTTGGFGSATGGSATGGSSAGGSAAGGSSAGGSSAGGSSAGFGSGSGGSTSSGGFGS